MRSAAQIVWTHWDIFHSIFLIDVTGRLFCTNCPLSHGMAAVYCCHRLLSIRYGLINAFNLQCERETFGWFLSWDTDSSYILSNVVTLQRDEFSVTETRRCCTNRMSDTKQLVRQKLGCKHLKVHLVWKRSKSAVLCRSRRTHCNDKQCIINWAQTHPMWIV